MKILMPPARPAHNQASINGASTPIVKFSALVAYFNMRPDMRHKCRVNKNAERQPLFVYRSCQTAELESGGISVEPGVAQSSLQAGTRAAANEL